MVNLSELLTASSRAFAPPVYHVPDFRVLLANLFPDWQEILEQLDERDRAASVTLGKQGWYLDLEFTNPQLFGIASAIEEGLATNVNEVLCDWYEERLPQIELDLSARHPHRGLVLRDAFQAHREGKYTLSVPVFLAQADGICHDLTGHQLYSRPKGVPALAKLLSLEPLTSVRASALHALSQRLPISDNAQTHVCAPDLLNRHAVLHGEDLNYHTRTQSCRAISLLNCVSWVFHE